jgi:hypothetical protein
MALLKPDGSEQALHRHWAAMSAGRAAMLGPRRDPAAILPLAYEPNHTTHDLARVADLMLEANTLEGRAVRAEEAMNAALARAHYLECQLDSVRMALRLERVPREVDGSPLTLMGRIRFLGDRARRAEHKAGT